MSILSNKYRGTPLYFRVMADLIRAAEYRGTTTYQDIAMIMGLPLSGSHMASEVGHILGEIAEDEVTAKRPMLAAVAVSVTGKVGSGFFDLARRLGRMGAEEDETAVAERERRASYEAWKRPLKTP